ncbi:MAG: D-alanine--D-alanine ligase [Deltaproteobacteria bacterium]|nr:MAG: D-alanine--D-alanine ligase [Deltaproteobacteria bacterium]
MGKRTVALIAGGWSREREVSLQSGAFVYESLDKDKYEVRRYDPKSDLAMLIRDSKEIDIALVVLHGKKGEDGCFQGLLDLLDVPYVGSGVLASSLAMNKQVSKELYRSAGLTVPRDIVLFRGQEHDPVEILSSLGRPVVIKPVAEGSSIGLSICSTTEELGAALDEAFAMSAQVLAEEYIKGREVSCGVIGNSKPEALPVIEIIPQKEHRFFSYEAKYVPGESKEICPATLPDDVCKKIQAYALKAHSVLGCKGFSRSDMIVTGDEVYLLETNTLPGMTKNSLFPLAVRAAGLTIPQFLDRLIELALED